ncbi:C-type mannose receptor 2-like [Cydia fagiglandana]|uniref:C-type mannose receptor 2-like n=1 Tax=Cydia fagiglandana TaxID=1458189 RepID=UPI002FEE2A6F
MILFSVISLAFCLSVVVVAHGKLFRFDYDYYQEAEGWIKLHQIPATWRDARLRCFREGAALASPETENLRHAMQSVLMNNQAVTCGIFTGIHATYSKGDYNSIDGTPLNRIPINWAPDEPDNADNNEDCLLMLPNGTMADVNCSDVFPYVCYKKKLPNMAVNNCGTVDKSYALDTRTGSCYKFHTEPQTWPRAFSACSGEGGHLAVINSETEAQVLREIYAQHPPGSLPGNFIKHVVHIGHTDWEEHGMWMTIHGQTLKEAGYDKWAGGQPDNSSSQFCGAMFNNGQLDDVWCDRPCPFICEKKPDSLLADDDF